MSNDGYILQKWKEEIIITTTKEMKEDLLRHFLFISKFSKIEFRTFDLSPFFLSFHLTPLFMMTLSIYLSDELLQL